VEGRFVDGRFVEGRFVEGRFVLVPSGRIKELLGRFYKSRMIRMP
jgi:hypothetical protein